MEGRWISLLQYREIELRTRAPPLVDRINALLGLLGCQPTRTDVRADQIHPATDQQRMAKGPSTHFSYRSSQTNAPVKHAMGWMGHNQSTRIDQSIAS